MFSTIKAFETFPLIRGKVWLHALIWFLSPLLAGAAGPFFISEILFNPPGVDAPNEYIELRGVPNSVFPPGSYLVGVEGDAGDNPGEIQDVFDLSGRSIGANGFLLLLQKTNSYTFHPLCRALIQIGSDPGWGHAGGSSLKHRGQSGQTDLENASVTFMLILSAKSPGLGDDIDSDDDGHPDGSLFAAWTVFDSVGILDADGIGDVAYGAINFRRPSPPGNGAMAEGVVVPVPFTPSYVARVGDSTGYGPSDWVASDSLVGTAPRFSLGDQAHTVPATLAGALLDHLGSPNFGASALAGISIGSLTNSAPMREEGATNAYPVVLTVTPSSEVRLAVFASPGLEVSTDGGGSFESSALLRMSGPGPFWVLVRTVNDDIVQNSPRPLLVEHAVLPPGDPAFADAVVPPLVVSVLDDEVLLLGEVLVNPLGPDGSRQFIELRGTPEATLASGVKLLVIDGKAKDNPGVINSLIDVGGARLGGNGLLFISAPDHPYSLDSATRFLGDDRFSNTNGFLPKDTLSLLLVATPSPLVEGADLDGGDNGQLEGLPKYSTILDSISWLHSVDEDVAYGAVLSDLPGFYPDAATRFPGDDTPRSATAWFYGDVKDGDPLGLRYDRQLGSSNLPIGAVLTPGVVNDTPPVISKLDAFSGALEDPTNPSVTFLVTDLETPPEQIQVQATSSDPRVVPDGNLVLTPLGGGGWRLAIEPTGVGYATIQIHADDGRMVSQESFRYAASRPGGPRTRFLIGSGDGSTAIPVSGNRILVGDDENQVIRLYDRASSGYPLAQFDITPFLELTDIEKGVPREVDIEGSTRVGNRLFWMGAHSHASIAEIRTNRSRIFATDLKDTAGGVSLAYVGRYDYLKVDLVEWDESNAHGKGAGYYGLMASTQPGVDPKAADGSGFNLEGLSMAPGSAEVAYVACRAPIVPATNRTHALIIPVLNFASLAAGNGPPGSARFGAPIELDLFGRGIRSIEGVGTNYLIVAGPARTTPTNYPNDFRLYTWTGSSSDAPQLRGASLGGLNPEGIVELPELPWTPDREVQLLSDCGTAVWYGDDVITKALPSPNFKKCRLDWVTLGPVVLPEPIILEVRPSADFTLIRWRGLLGQRYRVQWAADLRAPLWSDVPGDVLASEPNLSKLHSIPSGTDRRYYRVSQLP